MGPYDSRDNGCKSHSREESQARKEIDVGEVYIFDGRVFWSEK